jgi:hypothetical protein
MYMETVSIPKTKTVWETLSAINVNENIEKKNGFSYLSWSWAWATLMDHYPHAEFYFENQSGEFGDLNNDGVIRYADGTAEVRCVLTVEDITHTMWLPVMDYKNQAIKNPNARDINDAKMRCLVKAMSLFGLGLYIYAGEDLPDASKQKPAPAPAAETTASIVDEKAQLLKAVTDAATLDDLKAAFTKASKYARNRNDDVLFAEVTKTKDARKAALSK